MCNTLNMYIETNKILSNTQFGFKNCIRTGDVLRKFLNEAYKSINNSEVPAAVFLDLSKRFYIVNHDMLHGEAS